MTTEKSRQGNAATAGLSGADARISLDDDGYDAAANAMGCYLDACSALRAKLLAEKAAKQSEPSAEAKGDTLP